MNFNSLGARLREARKSLPKSQDEMATICGVSREMWGKYERDVAVPGGEVLAALANAGADILYILTGTKAATQRALGHVRTASEAASRLGASKAEQAHAAEAMFKQLNEPPLSRRQRALLDNYDHTDEAGKKIIEATASFAAQQDKCKKA